MPHGLLDSIFSLGRTPFLDGGYTVFGEVEEGLGVVEKDDAPRVIYNLHGQKLDRLPTSGIVIVNGRKYLIK